MWLRSYAGRGGTVEVALNCELGFGAGNQKVQAAIFPILDTFPPAILSAQYGQSAGTTAGSSGMTLPLRRGKPSIFVLPCDSCRWADDEGCWWSDASESVFAWR